MSSRHVVVVNWKDRAHPEAGGAEVYCEAVAAELVRLGMRVTYLTSRPSGTSARDARDGYAIRRLGGTYTVYLRALIWLLLHRHRIDAVIDSQNGIPFFTPLALRRSTSIVLLIHHVHQDQFALYFSPLMARVGRWLERTGSRVVYGERAVAAVSPSSRSEIRRKLGLHGAIHVVPNGTDGVAASSVADRAPVPTITCVGRLVPHKRWDLLIDAAGILREELPDLRVNLVGAGPESAALQRRVDEHGLGDTVVLHGFVDAEVRDELLAQAWLTVSTSVGEGWGLSIVEAAAQGVPAVAIDVPGLRDSVRDGVTGWLAAEDDLHPTLAGALEALADPVRAASYAGHCREWADSLRWSASAERFHAIFAEEALRLSTARAERDKAIDSATVVALDHAAACRLDLTMLLPADQTTFCPACVDLGPIREEYRVLLLGRDERDALAWLTEAGVDPRDYPLRMSVCRSYELLSWQGHGHAHSYLSTIGGARCPVLSARRLEGHAR